MGFGLQLRASYTVVMAPRFSVLGFVFGLPSQAPLLFTFKLRVSSSEFGVLENPNLNIT